MSNFLADSHGVAKQGGRGFSLRAIVTILFRRRFVALAIALPLIIIGGINLFGQAGSYTASTRVLVELVRVDRPKWNPSKMDVDYDRELNTLINSAMTMPVAQSAALALEDSIQTIKKLNKELLILDEPNGLAEFLLSGLDVSVVGESAILDFQFTSSSPRISLMAVGALRTAFLDFQVNGLKNDGAVDYYKEQLTGVRANMDSLLSTRSVILTKAGYSSLTDEQRYDSGRLASIETDLLSASVARRALQAQYSKLVVYLQDDPRNFPMGPDENRSSTLVYWMNKVAMHDDELNKILSQYTETSGHSIRQKALIQDSLKNLAAEEKKYVQSIDLALVALTEKERTLRDQVTEVRIKNSKAPEVYRKVSLLDSELKSLRSLLSSLQGKIGEVRLAQFADERVSNTMVISEPSIISVLTGGATIIYFIALVLISLALGVICGFVVENLDHRVYSPIDVEENLKLPVFASVSRVE